jgi:hypothetical protein
MADTAGIRITAAVWSCCFIARRRDEGTFRARRTAEVVARACAGSVAIRKTIGEDGRSSSKKAGGRADARDQGHDRVQRAGGGRSSTARAAAQAARRRRRS